MSDYSQLSDYNCTEWLVKNEAANAPIRIEEFVMVMIIKEIDFVHTEILALERKLSFTKRIMAAQEKVQSVLQSAGTGKDNWSLYEKKAWVI